MKQEVKGYDLCQDCNLAKENDKMEKQRENFIKYMLDTIADLKTEDVDDEELKEYLLQRIYTYIEILDKYTESEENCPKRQKSSMREED